jgi:alpha-1,2-mannosyltransferase
VAFYVFFASHVAAALYSPIQDCDEVFNYWEPVHYLTRGHGFQTWEYAPEFAIRSWAYAGLHAIVLPILKLLPYLTSTKVVQFYFLRIVLGFVCAVCEARLFSKVATTLNGRVAMLYLLITATSPGMYHASVAFLPSSFAMYFVMLGMAAFLDWRGGLRTAQGIWCFGVGACFGWPFAVILAAPFLVEELFMASLSDKQGRLNLVRRLLDGVVRAGGTLFLQIAIDCCFYRKFELVPLNIVMYNVFSNKGPDLYGTEPWHFYIRNLFLNFHFWLPLAVLSLPLLVLQQVTRGRVATKSSYLRGVIFLSPFYLWLAIFTLQPHKEERFMYPAYPAIALNAAIAFNIVLANMGSTSPQDLVSRIPVQLRLGVILAFVFVANTFFAWRTYGTIEAYGAPLSIYQPLHEPGMAQSGNFVCLGKEWYRFPSHFLLPDGVRAKFIKSEFSGLLPGEFSEIEHGFGLFPGAWISPPGMNDENREDIYKYTDVRRCTFIVDSHLPSTQTTALEPSYILDERTWEKVKCLPYLDNASTGIVGRLGWTSDLPFIPAKYKRVWGEYCLLKRRSKPQVQPQGAYTNIELLL